VTPWAKNSMICVFLCVQKLTFTVAFQKIASRPVLLQRLFVFVLSMKVKAAVLSMSVALTAPKR